MKTVIDRVCPMKFATSHGDARLCDGERCMWFVRMNMNGSLLVEFCGAIASVLNARVGGFTFDLAEVSRKEVADDD